MCWCAPREAGEKAGVCVCPVTALLPGCACLSARGRLGVVCLSVSQVVWVRVCPRVFKDLFPQVFVCPSVCACPRVTPGCLGVCPSPRLCGCGNSSFLLRSSVRRQVATSRPAPDERAPRPRRPRPQAGPRPPTLHTCTPDPRGVGDPLTSRPHGGRPEAPDRPVSVQGREFRGPENKRW